MTDSWNQPSEADLRDLAALADGSLPEERRAEVEARVAASPVLSDELARQRRALHAIRVAGSEVRAPASLRARLEELQGARKSGRPASRKPRSAGRPWSRIGAIAAAGAAAAAVAVGLIVLGGGEPTVDEAAQLASQPPTASAPATQSGQPTLLAASFEGLAYPNWEQEFGWRAVGERSDELDGRATHTVVYENREGRRIAYTIVSGDALDPPAEGEESVVDGVELAAFEADGAEAVTWLRDGHSCVLAGKGVERSTLLELAAWKGEGAVTF
jgi:anti-sigma factor RsiW